MENMLTLPYYKEEWRDIAGYEGKCQISSFGRVRSLDRIILGGRHQEKKGRLIKGKILQPILYNTGYLFVSLGKNNRKAIHRLVGEAFIPNPENKPHIDHINTNRSDNRVQNLQWVTPTENALNPLTVLLKKEIHKGYKNYNFGANPDESIQAKPVIQYSINNEFIRYYGSLRSASLRTDIDISNISACCLGKRKSAGGFIWQYAT